MTKKESNKNIGYILIDPPVTPYSSEVDILTWIENLKTLPDRPEVKVALEQAQNMLELSRDNKL